MILYDIFIKPLIALFSFVLMTSAEYLPIAGSIIVLSIFVQIISVPLYALAYNIEKKEKDIQKRITPELHVLKTLYKGEELFHRTDALYSRYKYNPLLAIRESMSLFLVIPFFISAYQLLSHNPIFDNETFFGIFPLYQPDGLLFGINILPILMTVFNLVAIKYANPKVPLLNSSNSTLLVLAMFFLVYLYNSSSALLVYWTMNNFIYMLKLLTKTKNH